MCERGELFDLYRRGGQGCLLCPPGCCSFCVQELGDLARVNHGVDVGEATCRHAPVRGARLDGRLEAHGHEVAVDERQHRVEGDVAIGVQLGDFAAFDRLVEHGAHARPRPLVGVLQGALEPGCRVGVVVLVQVLQQRVQ